MRHQAGSDAHDVGPRRESTTISCGSITLMYVNLAIPGEALGHLDRPMHAVFGPDGGFRRKWGGPLGLGLHGWWPGWIRVATGVAVGSRDRVYVADFPNDRILVVSANGTSLGIFGNAGAVPARLEHATDVAVADDGAIYVVESAMTGKPCSGSRP